jgi:hypothetical protein
VKNYRFEQIQIKECTECGKKDVLGIHEGFTTWFGIGESHVSKEVCLECFENNSYTNQYGFTFLILKDKMFCYKPDEYLDFGFREVTSPAFVNNAFNPDRAAYDKWLNSYGDQFRNYT